MSANNGKLYDASMHFVFETLADITGSNSVAQINDETRPKSFRVSRAKSRLRALCGHNGKLYDGGNYGLYETLTNKKAYTFKSPINALISGK